MSDSQLESKPESEKSEKDHDFVAQRKVEAGKHADRTNAANVANGRSQAESSQARGRGWSRRFSKELAYASNAARRGPVAPLHGAAAKPVLDVVLPAGFASQNPTVVANLLRGVIPNTDYTAITQIAAKDPHAARVQLTKQFASLTNQVATSGDAVALGWLANAAQDPTNAIKYYYAAAQRVQRLPRDLMPGLRPGINAAHAGQPSAIGVFTGRFDPAALKNKENGTNIPEYPDKRLLGDKGKIGANDLAQMPSQHAVMAESLRVFEAWKKTRVAEGKPTELYQQGGIDNMAKFGSKRATPDASQGVTARSAVSIQPSKERAAENRAEAQKAAAAQQRKAAQFAALLKGKAARKEIIETDVIIAGAGQSGIMDFATHKATAGTKPSDNVTSVPSIFVIAPAGSMFAAHGATRIGQKPGELATPALTRQIGDFTDEHSKFAKASDVTDALASTANDKGMTQFYAAVQKVEHNPNNGSWPSTKKLRVTADGVELYCNQFDSALGLGAPVPLGKRIKGERLNTADTTGETGETKLAQAGLLVHAQLSLVLPNPETKNRVAVVGDGPSGAWAVLRALESGSEHVYWYGNSDYVRQAPAALRKELTRLAMTPEQINVFFGAFNIRNKGAFTDAKLRVHFVDGFKDAEINSANSKEVVIHTTTGTKVVDGVVSAVGSLVQMPKGVASNGSLRPVVKRINEMTRVVALEGIDAEGKPNGIRLVGAQIFGAGVEELIVKDKLQLYQTLKRRQATDPTAPTNSKGVLGSLHTTAENAQLMNS